ncbi:MAG: SufE family protein, partial [Flavobacteriales bacterium]|nr:SufE family protein [Flavobacteriales bacterium]
MTIQEKQEELIAEFSLFEDWMSKYEYIIDLGKELPTMDEAFKNDDYLVKGCQSRVWLHPAPENGKLNFEADSDAIISKGLIAIILRVYSGHTPE